jgi:hypothetical protein
MVTSSAGLGPENDNAGKAQWQLYEKTADMFSRQGRSTARKKTVNIRQ